MKYVDTKLIEDCFGKEIGPKTRSLISTLNLEFESISNLEFQNLIILIIDFLLKKEVVQSGSHRINDWESGWEENLQKLTDEEDLIQALIPKYFDKYNVVRINGDFVRPITKYFEYHLLEIILSDIFEKYAFDAKNIYEFGCGPAYHLLQAREFNANCKLYGLDWAASSQKIISEIRNLQLEKNIFGSKFNYFEPDEQFKIHDGSMVMTVASLEQVGKHWRPFVDYLLDQDNFVCVNIEPITELLDDTVLLDNLSQKYFQKRNYLDGFLTGLQALEAKGRIEILDCYRTRVGSLFIEGYSVVIWRPKK